jgi:hypothetical protein
MSIILIEKVLLAQLDKKFTQFFMEWDISLLIVHDHSIGPYHQAVEYILSSVHYFVLNERRINGQRARRNKMKFTYDVLS